MKIAVMQPYFFPYIGYFQLISAVDKFVFYDDVNFIKNGWINRNRIIVNNETVYLTVQLRGASPNKKINEVQFTDNRKKLLKTVHMAYRRAPFYNDVFPLIEQCMNFETNKINELAMFSILKVMEFLSLKTKLEISSVKYAKYSSLSRVDRLKMICNSNGANEYINSVGGESLYQKNDFEKSNIKLYFLHPIITEYSQFSKSFFPNLSIIDVLMFNSAESVLKMLSKYELQ